MKNANTFKAIRKASFQLKFMKCKKIENTIILFKVENAVLLNLLKYLRFQVGQKEGVNKD